jgi:diguanylate cyclase (GGDEF)-like protein
VAVAYIDLDHFKMINDEFGHAAGDELLRVVAGRLHGATRADDQLARLGGDEFVVICRRSDGPFDAAALVERLTEAINGDVVFAAHRIPLCASVGVAVALDGELDAEAVLHRADTAMYEAKRRARARGPVERTTETDAERSDSMRVLLVDDECSMRNLLRLTLEDDEQFRIVGEAPDGREAVALARHHQPDLVLLDLAMPGVGGLEALPLIRAAAPRAQVVVLSGLDPEDVADEARAQGAAGYLCKGTDPARYVDDLRRFVAS